MTIPKEKLCVALDCSDKTVAKNLVKQLNGHVGLFKIGKELFTTCGPDIVRHILDHGEQVFLDLKFHDIPNTVRKACCAAAKLGVALLNVHAMGGLEMMQAGVQGIKESGATKTKLLAVTVLTSVTQEMLKNDLCIEVPLNDYVVHLAGQAKAAGLDGVVASPHEIALIRKACGSGFIILTPGVRPLGAAQGDQKRVMTPEQAIMAGADYIVVGRPITEAKDLLGAVRMLISGPLPVVSS